MREIESKLIIMAAKIFPLSNFKGSLLGLGLASSSMLLQSIPSSAVVIDKPGLVVWPTLYRPARC